MNYDVAIIGAGVVGTLIARELSAYDLSVVLLEKCNDVAMGTTKANSAIVHAGFDAEPGTLKAKLSIKGCCMMESVCEELGVPYKNIGSLVIAFNDTQMHTLTNLLLRGNQNGVQDLRIIGQDKLRELEPNVNVNAKGALWAPTAAIICPYGLAIAAAENAVTNGVELKRNFEVKNVSTEDDGTLVLSSGQESVSASYVINSAGVYADKVAKLFGDNDYKIIARKGEYFLFDKKMDGLVKRVVFQCPTKMGKGVLIAPTTHGNVIIGPNAEDVDDKDNCATSAKGTEEVLKTARRSITKLSTVDLITSFAGLRAHNANSNDFFIEYSKTNKRVIHLVGIESPGLTAAPAIAKYVCSMFMDVAGKQKKNRNYNPVRPEPVRVKELADEQLRELIEKDSAYGRIVCRCETVSEGEIIDAIRAPVGATDVDGVKRRTRSGMGRCQGGFCGSKVAEILAREMGVDINTITKSGGNSNLLYDRTK